MKIKIKILFFFILVLCSFTLDKYLNPCVNETISLNIIHLLHHIGSNYFFFGSIIFNEFFYHFLLSIVTIISWTIYGGKCVISDIYNKICGLNINTRHRDLTYYLVKYVFQINIYEFITIIFLYDLYSLLTY